jgi:hypothetical protein
MDGCRERFRKEAMKTLLLAWVMSTTGADMVSTHSALTHKNTHETNWALGRHPSDAKIAAYGIGCEAGILAGWHIMRHHPKMRAVAAAGLGALEVGLASRNWRIK